MLLLLIAFLPLGALAAEPLERAPAGNPRQNQKIERLHHEDAANTIDEVRVGGQVQSVTVQPKKGPAYELQPQDMARSRPSDSRDGFSGSKQQRVWNFLNF